MAAQYSYRQAGSETLPGRDDSVHWIR
jgi:hypothetical protein